MARWLTILSAALVPGSGHVLLGRPMRGLVFLFWMVLLGYVTYHLTTQAVSLPGRLSGGLAVWVISILEVGKITRLRK